MLLKRLSALMMAAVMALAPVAEIYAQQVTFPIPAQLNPQGGDTAQSVLNKSINFTNALWALTVNGTANVTNATGVLPEANGGTGLSSLRAVRISPRIPQPGTYSAFGDSITGGGNYPAALNSAWIPTTAYNNRAITGAQAADVADLQVFPNENPTSLGNYIYTMMIGTNDANTKGAGTYETVYKLVHQASLSWLGIGSQYKVFAQAATATGTWTNDNTYQTGIGRSSNTQGDTLSFSLTTYGAPIYVWYRIKDTFTGSFSVAVDGTTAGTVNTFTSPAIATLNGTTQAVGVLRIPNIAAGIHTVLATVTSATGGTATVSLLGVGTIDIGHYGQPIIITAGVLKQQNDAKAADTLAYNTDALADAQQLQSDGMAMVTTDVRNYVNPFTEMTDALHPNSTGQTHLFDGFMNSAQVQPLLSTTGYAFKQFNTFVANTSLFMQPNALNVSDTNTLNPGVLLYSSAVRVLGDYFGFSVRKNKFVKRSFVSTVDGFSFSSHPVSTPPTQTSSFTDLVYIDGSGYFQLQKTFTVGTLPTPTTDLAGAELLVSDAAATPTYRGTATGGGSITAKVFCTGTTWVYE